MMLLMLNKKSTAFFNILREQLAEQNNLHFLDEEFDRIIKDVCKVWEQMYMTLLNMPEDMKEATIRDERGMRAEGMAKFQESNRYFRISIELLVDNKNTRSVEGEILCPGIAVQELKKLEYYRLVDEMKRFEAGINNSN